MANPSSEMKSFVDRIWHPTPVVGASGKLAAFANREVLGRMAGEARIDVISTLTVNPSYSLLDHPEPVDPNHYVTYTKFLTEVLPQHPRYRQPLVDIWQDLCALTNPFYDILRGTDRTFLEDLDAIRKTENLDKLVYLGLIDPKNARFLSQAVRYNPRSF